MSFVIFGHQRGLLGRKCTEKISLDVQTQSQPNINLLKIHLN